VMETDNANVARTPLSRRRFLLAALGAVSLPRMVHGAGAARPLRLLSPAGADGSHYAASIEDGRARHAVSLPMRGHGMVVDPRKPHEALIIARRPGTTVARIGLDTGHLLQQWHSDEDRHFYGHACYSADGGTLFLTENDVATGEGLVTVRDAVDLKVLAEYATHGIGPHELMMLADGKTLVVANGGILTLPETGRVKLNRGRIASSLVYLDSETGRLLGKYMVPSKDLSLRHLAVCGEGRVAAALQFEGDRRQPGGPLLMFHHGEDALQFAAAPPDVWDRMRHYAASVAYDPSSAQFALSCPLGNTLGCWTSAGAYAGSISIPKVSGIAFGAGQGFASNEAGQIFALNLATLSARLVSESPRFQWDNHLYLA
jgi:hypothetical protein